MRPQPKVWLREVGRLAAILALAGCPPKVEVSQVTPEDYGCKPPPPSVFTQAGTDIQTARSEFGKVVVGEIKISSKPEVISLASEAGRDAELKGYLRCLAIARDKYTNTQAAYLESLTAFAATKPSAQEFQQWQDSHPFPKN